MKTSKFTTTNRQKGTMLIVVLVATGIFLVMLMGSVSLGVLQQKLNIKKVSSAQALHIAEAGVNYYRWVLYHDNEEYCNKEICLPAPDYGPYGPYEYKDSNDNIAGYYELYITPTPPNGSTIVNIKSIGWVIGNENIKRSIEVQCGIPSWSAYSGLSNAEVRYGAGSEVWGRIHSNTGIRFDGIAHNLVTSSVLDYDDPDHAGPDEYGVHTHVYTVGVYDTDEVSDGSNPPNPPDYSGDPNNPFLAGRQFPVPVVSFDLLTDYVNDTLAKAQSNGLVIPNTNQEGYHIILNTDDTIDIYEVTNETGKCSGNYTHKISSEIPYLIAEPTPANGIIFVKDKVWIEGKIDGNRITILAFEDPISGSKTDIIINNDIEYTNYDGTDAIGLIAQRNILIGLYSEGDFAGTADQQELRIDGALIAKEGKWGRDYFGPSCGATWTRNNLTIYGTRASKLRSGVSYSDGSGYQNRDYIYDNNLTFAPPPHYPTTGEYTFISWKEE